MKTRAMAAKAAGDNEQATQPAETKRKHAQINEQRLLRFVGFNVVRADLRLRSDFYRHMKSLGLRQAEFSVLLLLLDNPQIAQKSLGHSLRISPPNMATLLDRLVERGLITRSRSTADRRAQHPQLTEVGHALVLKAIQVVEALEANALASLSAGERLLLIEMLQKIGNDKSQH